MRKLIYSKQYPKPDFKLLQEKSCDDDGDIPAFMERIEERLTQHLTYQAIPGRWDNSRRFIDIATDVSKTYRYDIEIYETDKFVQVLLSFDSHYTSGALNRLFHMADDFSFFAGIKNREITVAMDFYTIAVCRDGERLMPDNRYYFD